MSIAFVACRAPAERRDPPPAPPQARTAPQADEAPFVASGLAHEPSSLALVAPVEPDGRAGVARVVADLDDARVLLGPGGHSVPRAPSSRLHLAALLDGVVTTLAIEGRDWVVATLEPTPRVARTVGTAEHATMRRASSGRSLYVAHTEPHGPVSLDVYRLGPTGFEVDHPVVDRGGDELGREVVGLTADADGFALLFRRSSPEDSRGGVSLATELGTREVEALHDLALLESLSRERGVLAVVGSFEFDRPIAFELDPRGAVGRIERLAPGQSPGFVATRARATLELDGGAILVRIRSASGDPLVERRFERRHGATAPTIVRDRHGFAIAWTERTEEGWGVRLAHVGVPSP